MSWLLLSVCAVQLDCIVRMLQLEQPAGIPAHDLGLVLDRYLKIVQPACPRRIRHEGPVDREEDAVDAELQHRAEQGRRREVAAGGDVDVLAELLAEGDRTVAG